MRFVGYVVVALWLAGRAGLIDFSICVGAYGSCSGKSQPIRRAT